MSLLILLSLAEVNNVDYFVFRVSITGVRVEKSISTIPDVSQIYRLVYKKTKNKNKQRKTNQTTIRELSSCMSVKF